MSRPMVNANAGMFMMSGTETTAPALTSMTWCLLNNPEKLKKVVQEIRAIPEESGLTSSALKNMKYKNAVIEEGMRMYPSGQVGLGSQREIAPGGNWVCGEWLPQKTQVLATALGRTL